MRQNVSLLVLALLPIPLFAQREPPPARGVRYVSRPGAQAVAAEMAIKQAMEQLGIEKKIYDRDLEVLRHLRAADEALADPMQPLIAIQKSYEEVGEAKSLRPEFQVYQGVIKAQEEIHNARLSPASAEFGRLRAMLRSEAITPAVRAVARNGLRLHDETLSWLRLQELIATHLRTLAEIVGESLRAAQ